jgi:hypothetical protein
MPVYTIQSPDGRKIKIEAADEVTAVRGAQEWAAANPNGDGSFKRPFDLSGGQSRAGIPRGSYYRDREGNIRRNDNADRGNPVVWTAKKGKPTASREVAGFMANVNRGLGVADEAAAGLGVVRDAFTGNIRPRGDGLPGIARGIKDSLDFNMASQRAYEDDFASRRPKVAALARGSGNALTVFVPAGAAAQGTTRLNALAQGAVAGATQGAAYGLVDRGTLQERVRAGQAGAVVGAMAGGALGAATARPARKAKRVDPNVRLLAEEGVQMTPGQIRGGIAKSLEDKLTSTPILGDEIIRARRSGMETFTRAPIGRGLREIGEELPPGVTGNEAIAFAQGRFREGYDAVVPTGGVRLDDEFGQGLGQSVSPILETLTPEARERLQGIITSRLSSQAQGGALTGEAFKRVQSGLEYEIGRFSSSPDPDQRAIAEALKAVKGQLRDTAARQNPDFASRLASLDRGYAQLVRAETAAARTGAEEGVFSPAQYDMAVRAGDQSVRRRGYAAGNALGQDLADAGRAVLPSRVPDSGTAGRGIVGLMLGGGGYAAGGPVGLAATGVGLKAASSLYSPRAIELANRALSERIAREEADAAVNELRRMAMEAPEVLPLLREVEARLARAAAGVELQSRNPLAPVPAGQ